MAITKFNEINDLWYYFSASLSVVSKTGDAVDSVASVVGDDQGTKSGTITNPGAEPVNHNPSTILINQCPAFDNPGTNLRGALTLPLDTSYNNQAMTVVIGIQAVDTVLSATRNFISAESNTSSTRVTVHEAQSQTDYVFRMHNQTDKLSGVAVTTNPAVVIATWNLADAASQKLWIDGVEVPSFSSGTSGLSIDQMTWMGQGGNNRKSMGGKASKLLIYGRALTQEEVTDVTTLVQYWHANGEAPSAGPGPSAMFGPVATNDDPSVTGWQWEESSDGVAWANVGTILADVTGATTTSLTVNSAPIEADQTRVRCKAVSAQEPAGVYSNAAILTVQ